MSHYQYVLILYLVAHAPAHPTPFLVMVHQFDSEEECLDVADGIDISDDLMPVCVPEDDAAKVLRIFRCSSG